MKKQPLFVAFSSQKGGVGKSALSVLMASYYHYVKGTEVLVVDCDYPQHSMKGMRERDKQTVMGNETYKQMLMQQFERIGRKAYNIITASPAEAREVADRYLEQSETEYDIVFFDMPGTVSSPGVLTTIFNMDYIFIPIITDRMIMQSSLSFASTVQDYISLHKDVPLKNIYLLWNRVDKRVSAEVYEAYAGIIKKMRLKVLSTELPESYRFSKELSIKGKQFFRSTLFPPMPKLMKGSNIEPLAEEISKLIGL